ncbi:MAG: gliding motility-associated C-terminal domain-containing protein [Prevotellaceae bacterium]|jgi:fibronectin type 3 domain-containing protein|nr:gliding motility-associated C-terminal domain-containing protein [Prevotellaceae bacterium]
MKDVIRIILISTLTVVLITTASSQCLPPPPVIESITVVPNTGGNITLRWHGNPADTCTTTGYEIYKYNYITHQFDFLILVTAITTNYTETNAGADIRPQIYRMTTKAGPAGNEHSENHHSVFLNPVLRYDPCEFTATVLWTPYKTSYRDKFEIRQTDKKFNDSIKYQIVGYIAPSASPFNLQNAVPLSPVTSDTTVNFRMIVNKNYLFCVKTYLPNGDVSYSNVREGIIAGNDLPAAPLYINLDSLVSFDTYNHLHFEIENSTQMTKFQIERSTDIDSTFKAIHTFSDKNTTVYDDYTCDVNKKYFYRVTAFNNIAHCVESPSVISDTLNSIIINTKYANPNISVSWNDFIRDSVYYLHRNGLFWLLLDVTQFTDMDVQNDFSNNVYDFCYRITAVDRTANFASISREYCISLDKPVTMPNAIDPASTFTNNVETYRRRNQFAPIVGGKETDYEYHMIIFNRWNTVIFETTKPMDVPISKEHFWNGASAKGNVLPEDTYLYYVKIIFKNSSQVFEQKGTVSLIYQ